MAVSKGRSRRASCVLAAVWPSPCGPVPLELPQHRSLSLLREAAPAGVHVQAVRSPLSGWSPPWGQPKSLSIPYSDLTQSPRPCRVTRVSTAAGASHTSTESALPNSVSESFSHDAGKLTAGDICSVPGTGPDACVHLPLALTMTPCGANVIARLTDEETEAWDTTLTKEEPASNPSRPLLPGMSRHCFKPQGHGDDRCVTESFSATFSSVSRFSTHGESKQWDGAPEARV